MSNAPEPEGHLDATLRDAILAWVNTHERGDVLSDLPSVIALGSTTGPSVPWDVYAVALNDLADQVGDHTLVQELPAMALQRPAFRALLEAMATVASPALFYRFYFSITLRRSPGVLGEWLPAPAPDAVRFTFRMDPRPEVPCEVHYRIAQRFMAELPVLVLGTQEPTVELETDGIDGTYTVYLPPSRTLFVRVRNMWNAALGRDPMSSLAYEEQQAARAQARQLRDVLSDLDRRVAERTAELEAVNVDLMKASANKSRHLADMSHELRTPLNAIIGYAEMLAEDARERSEQEDLGRIEVAARHLLSLVDNVLDLSKIEAGQLDVRHEPVDLEPLIRSLVAGLAPVLEGRGNQVRVDVTPLVAIGDELRIRQILANVLGNAAKFTEEGTITVSTASEGGRVRIDVADTGAGMDPPTLERVFLPYAQGTQPSHAPFKGTGLGLPISRELAQLMHGRLSATSVPGEGSTFTLFLPAP